MRLEVLLASLFYLWSLPERLVDPEIILESVVL